jgi:hypothetical protein
MQFLFNLPCLSLTLLCAGLSPAVQAADAVYQSIGSSGSIELSNIDDTTADQTPVAVETASPVTKSRTPAKTIAGKAEADAAPDQDRESEAEVAAVPSLETPARTDEEVAKVFQDYRETMVKTGNMKPTGGSSAASRRYLMVDKNTFMQNAGN